MRTSLRLVALLSLALAAPAVASEQYIGKIVSAAGADTTNGTTATPFRVPPATKLTLWCSASAFIAVDTLTASSATSGALPVTAQEKFPTSTGSAGSNPSITVSSQLSAVVRISGPAAVTCYVSVRLGNE